MQKGVKIKGQVISGDFGRILVRQKHGSSIELGELMIAETEEGKSLLQVYDLLYGSQISQQNLELVSGLSLEEDTNINFIDSNLRNYNMAILKSLISIDDIGARTSKTLPRFFSSIREVTRDDLYFLTEPKNPLFLGKLRSGSKVLDFNIHIDGEKTFSHHILITATTGRGKSNLTSCILWDAMEKDYCGILVLDPHDEYYGRNDFGLKDHPAVKGRTADKLVYYTPRNTPPGCKTLKINLEIVKPHHFNGVVEWSSAQNDALSAFYKRYGKEWVEAVVLERGLDDKFKFNEATLGVVRRKLMNILGLDFSNNKLSSKGVFSLNAGESTIKDIASELEDSKTVVVDSSGFPSEVELLIGSLITTEVFNRYKKHKQEGTLKEKPVISIVLEEAPRVLGKEVLEQGPNIFSTIAREGRKFRIGLTAITQLPSLIPRQILANMNTKIILGIEMKPERQAVIESAAQDLSNDDRNIASLDKGEAIVTSTFARFATPIKIPLFRDFAGETKQYEPDSDASINTLDLPANKDEMQEKGAGKKAKKETTEEEYETDFGGIEIIK